MPGPDRGQQTPKDRPLADAPSETRSGVISFVEQGRYQRRSPIRSPCVAQSRFPGQEFVFLERILGISVIAVNGQLRPTTLLGLADASKEVAPRGNGIPIAAPPRPHLSPPQPPCGTKNVVYV